MLRFVCGTRGIIYKLTATVSMLPAAICTRSTVVPPLALTTAWKRRIFSSTRAISGFWMCLRGTQPSVLSGEGRCCDTDTPTASRCTSAARQGQECGFEAPKTPSKQVSLRSALLVILRVLLGVVDHALDGQPQQVLLEVFVLVQRCQRLYRTSI